MEAQEKKNAFVQLRAERRSYRHIAGVLGISKTTCCNWEKELREAVDELKLEQLNELYTAYAMTKEARIKKLGNALERIDTALAGADLESMPPEKLLDYKLKYTAALKDEYAGADTPYRLSERREPKELVVALEDLLNRVRAGEVSAEQANRECAVIGSILKAYETTELKDKLEALEQVVGRR